MTEMQSFNNEMLSLLYQRYQQIESAIRALGGTVPGTQAGPQVYSGLKPSEALERVLLAQGAPMNYDDIMATLKRGGLNVGLRLLRIAVTQGGRGDNRRFYTDGEGRVGLTEWVKRAA